MDLAAGLTDQAVDLFDRDTTVIHGDGTTTAAKKGGDNIGFSGHKKMKGDKVVAFCDRRCNVIAPFVSAPGNHNESPLLREALPEVMRIARMAVPSGHPASLRRTSLTAARPVPPGACLGLGSRW